jgi:hypothetical protein
MVAGSGCGHQRLQFIERQLAQEPVHRFVSRQRSVLACERFNPLGADTRPVLRFRFIFGGRFGNRHNLQLLFGLMRIDE